MTVASVLTVTLSLFVLGLFLVTVLNLNHMASYLENQVELSVYLKDGTTKAQVDEIDNRIRQISGVETVKFIDKEKAIQVFKDRLGEQKHLLDSLNGNPLPASFEIVMNSPAAVKQAAVITQQYKEVETVQYGQETIEQLFQFTKIIRIGGAVLILFLAFSTLFIISNTIRLTVFARRKEISIMKYVGATNGFIRWPFLLEGMILGFVGSIIAGVLIWQVYLWGTGELIRNGFAFLPILPTHPLIMYVVLFLLLTGVLIGGLGSSISIRKYMKV